MDVWPTSQKQAAICYHGNTQTYKRIMIIDEYVFVFKKKKSILQGRCHICK